MNYTNTKLLIDLEILNKVIPIIDNTITIYGKNKFKELFEIIYFDQRMLVRRREILITIINNREIRLKIKKELKQVKKMEKSIQYVFTEDQTECGDMMFQKDMLNVQPLLTTVNFLKIYSPSFIFIIYIFLYSILRYKGIKINIKDYFYGIYKGYQMSIELMLNFLTSNTNLNSFLTNTLSTMYVVYQLYGIYNSIESSTTHYGKCTQFNNKIADVRKVLNSIKKIYKNDIFLKHEKKMLHNKLIDIDQLFSPDKINSLGYSLLLKKNFLDYEKDFNTILQYAGLLDSFISISDLVIERGFIFPYFDFDNPIPYIDCINVWVPSNFNEQVTNNCYLGNSKFAHTYNSHNNNNSNNYHNAMILTGPNTSGKSTYIRNVMLAVLFAQTIGITSCQSLTFTPFFNLYTYIDIPNIARNKESLFEAEIKRCMEFCTVLESIPSNLFTFTVMDELFTGTNPVEGASGSYAVCKYIGDFDNALLILTTHFNELTKLETDYPDRFFNKKFEVSRNLNGSFNRSYKIMDGPSNQNIAIELLYQKGYDSKIIDIAMKKLAEITGNI
jgi:DNA mismatch repair ATPase MutS